MGEAVSGFLDWVLGLPEAVCWGEVASRVVSVPPSFLIEGVLVRLSLSIHNWSVVEILLYLVRSHQADISC